jgi:hypothetical protein
MSDINTNKVDDTAKTDKFNTGTMTGVLNVILSAFSIPSEPISPLPPPLIIVGGELRTGLSAQAIAARIISRQSEAGRQVGDVFADGPNSEEMMEVIRVEEIINAILTESVVNIAIPPGIGITSVGIGNLGGPVVSQGMTTGIGIANGIIR